MATMNISLPNAMKDWVEEQVASGRYANASDYVRDVLRRDQERADAREKFDQMVEQGLASGVVDISREDLLARMEAKRLEALEAKRTA